MYNMIKIINTAVFYVQKLLSSHHNEKIFFSFILYTYEMTDVH